MHNDETGSGSPRPRAAPGIEVNEAPDGVVIYDPRTNEVHYLNPTAAAVFILCTGENDAREIAVQLQQVFSLPQPPEAEVAGCLADLTAQRLIE